MKELKNRKKGNYKTKAETRSQRRDKNIPSAAINPDFNSDNSILNSEIFNILDIGVFIIDVLPDNQFRIVGFNRISEEKTGISNKEIAGKTLDELKDFIPEESINQLKDNYSRCLNKKSRIRYEESAIVRGVEFWALTTLNPVRNKEGEINKIIGTTVIINDIKEKEKYLAEYQHKLETLITERTRDLARVNKELKDKAEENRKSAEELFESNEMFKFVLDTIPQRVFWKDKNFRFLGCNKKILEDGGLNSIDDVLGKDDFELPWKEFAQLYRDDDAYVMRNDVQKLDFEEPQNTPDGGVRWLKTNKMPLKDKEGNIFGVLGTYEDITEKKLNEEKIIESERFLRTILGNIPGMIYRCKNDRDWTMTFLSDRCYELTGYGKDEMLNNKTIAYADIIHPEDSQMVWDRVQNALDTQGKYEIEYRIITKNKEIKWVWEQGQGIYKDDELLYLEGYIRDNTNIKKTYQELSDSEQKYRELTESSEDYIYIQDLAGNLTYINNFGARAIGKMPDEIIGKKVNEIFSEQFAERFKTNVNTVFETRKPLTVDGEALFGGRKVWIHTHLIPLTDDSGRVNQVMGISRDVTELKKAEKKITESERIFRTFVDNASAGFSKSNLEGKIYYVNNKFLNIFEYDSIEQAKKENVVYRYKHPEDRKRLINLLQKIGKIDNFEFEAVSVKGKELVLSLSSRIEGESIESVFTDITDRVNTEKKLTEAEKSLRAFMNAIPQTAFLIDSDGTVLVSNRNTPLKYGIKYEDFIGKNFFLAVPDKYSADLRKNVIKLLNTKNPVMYEEKLNGQYFENYLFPVLDGNGTVSRIAIITIDNTDKIVTEEDTRYKSFLLTNVNDAIIATDRNRKITFWNDAAEEIYGWKSEEVLGKTSDEILKAEAPGEEKINAAEKINRLSSFSSNLVHYTKSGERITVEAKGFPIKNMKGELIGYGSINRNITSKLRSEEKLKKYAEELKDLNATKDRFFSIISHDLRNPFHALLGISDILQSKINELSKEEIINLSKSIHDTARREFDLLVNLLEWSVIQTGRLEIKAEEINIRDAVINTINLLRSNTEQKQIEVNHNFETDLLIISDKKITDVVLLNLLTNAIKYSHQNSEIMILHYTEQDYLKLIFRDHGTGMDSDTLSRLFRIDSRESIPGTENERGTGLGLIICREMLNKIGGSITASSKPGKGSTFTVTLPLKLNNGK